MLQWFTSLFKNVKGRMKRFELFIEYIQQAVAAVRVKHVARDQRFIINDVSARL